MSEIFIIKDTGKGVINSLNPENVVPLKSAGNEQNNIPNIITISLDDIGMTPDNTDEEIQQALSDYVEGHEIQDTELYQIKLIGFPDSSGGGQNTSIIDFTTDLKFDKSFSISNITQTEDFVFSINTEDIIPMGANYIRIISDGIHNVDLSAFKKQSGSGNFKKENNILNVLCFWFDGIDYWVNIWQDLIIPDLILTTVDFDNLYGSTFNNTTKILSGNANSGGYKSEQVNLLDGFEMILSDYTTLTVLGLSIGNSSNMIYGTTTDYVYGFYYQGTSIDLIKGSSRILISSTTATKPNFLKLLRDGDDAIFSKSDDGTNWIDLFTDINGFSGIDNAYLKTTFIQNGGTAKAQIKQ